VLDKLFLLRGKAAKSAVFHLQGKFLFF